MGSTFLLISNFNRAKMKLPEGWGLALSAETQRSDGGRKCLDRPSRLLTPLK